MVSLAKLHALTENILFLLTCRAFPPVSDTVNVVTYALSGPPYQPSRIKERALSCVGKKDYNLFTQNCEHFATWCVYGKGVSGNTRAAVMGGGTTVATAMGGGAGVIIGGAIGSIVPVAGTFVGGVVGGIVGTGVGAGVGIIGAGLGWLFNQVIQDDRDEANQFD